MKNKSVIAAICLAVVMLAGCGNQPADSTPAGAGSSAAGASAPAEDIGLDAAKAAALKHAGVSASDAEFTKAKLDYDDGTAEYDIEFTANSMKYEYEIKASDGTVLEFSAEKLVGAQTSQSTQTTSQGTQTTSQGTQGASSEQISERISENEAKQIALAHAGFSEAQVTFTECKLDYDDGVAEYDIEFTVNSAEYEYEIRASDGKVLEFSKEGDPTAAPTGLISESRAKEIALNRAGFSEAQVTFKRVKLDYDDGISKYEVEFTVNGTEYEFEINAKTGTILEMDIDHHDDHHDDHH